MQLILKIKYMGCYWWRYSLVFTEGIKSLNHLVLGDYVLWLDRRRSARMSRIGGCPEGKGVLFQEALADKFFQVFSEVFAMNSLVSLTVVVRTMFFHSGSVGLY